MNKKGLIWGGIITVVLIVLFALPRVNDPNRDVVKVWKDADVNCLLSHQQASQHIHPTLQILVNGKVENIPQDIGIVTSCMAEIHTHDATGTLHAESASITKEFTLGQFFVVYGKDMIRDGYTLEATANGEAINNPENIVLQDGLPIVLHYQSI